MKKEISRSNWFDLEGYNACTVRYSDDTRKTVLQHREIVEKQLGRKLEFFEVVHHKDEKKKNNDPDNLEIKLQMGKNSHINYHRKSIEWINITCIQCDKAKKIMAKDERRRIKKGMNGPFCGKSCSASWSGSGRKVINRKRKVDLKYVEKALYEGKSRRIIAKELGVHHSTISYYAKKINESGGK